MRNSLKATLYRLVTLLSLVGLCLGSASCNVANLGKDDQDQMVYYPSVGDIAPSTNFSVTPSYHGGKPTGFAVSGVTKDGAPVETECFTVDSETGVLSISGTTALDFGTYSISISCKFGDNLRDFRDAVTFTLLRPVPASISVEPSVVTVPLEDIKAGKADLPTADVVAEEGSVTIKKYLIANVYRFGQLANECKDWFSISQEGKISVVSGIEDFIPGEYTLDLKLTTYIVPESSEDGLYAAALKVDVTSLPLGLAYNPAESNVETGYKFESLAPAMVGSTTGLSYAIKSSSNPSFPVSIDAATGVVKADATSVAVGESTDLTVTVANAYGSKDFENALKISVVAYIAPITEFSYPSEVEAIRMAAFDAEVSKMDGGMVSYSFKNLDPALSELKIDASTGKVYALAGNSIALGKYTVTVTAKNSKGEKDASFVLNVIKNPNEFSFVHWGNNLGLTPARDYASQYRWTDGSTQTIPVAESDIPSGVNVKFESVGKVDGSNGDTAAYSVDAESGTLTFEKQNNAQPKFAIIKVTVSRFDGDPAAVVKKFPVFVHNPAAVDGINILYTPFAVRINPKTGGESGVPEISGTGYVADKFLMDYRRTFNFYRVNGPDSHKNLQPATADSFLKKYVWTPYYTALNKSVNTGSKDPVSYYSNKANLSQAYLYCDVDHKIVVNAEKWKDADGVYADGTFLGQITFVKDGVESGINNGKQIFPVIIWFDTDLIK